MASHQEPEGKSATRKDEEDVEEAAVPSKMKLAAHYAMLGFAPVVAMLALIVAVMAVSGNRSSQEQLGKAVAATDSLKTSLDAAKSELERLRFSMAHEKNRQDEERLRQEELEAKIIQNINQLQVKAKISPTLEMQLQQPASAPAAAPAAASAVAAPAAMAAATGADKKHGARMDALKEAIEQFNKQ